MCWLVHVLSVASNVLCPSVVVWHMPVQQLTTTVCLEISPPVPTLGVQDWA